MDASALCDAIAIITVAIVYHRQRRCIISIVIISIIVEHDPVHVGVGSSVGTRIKWDHPTRNHPGPTRIYNEPGTAAELDPIKK